MAKVRLKFDIFKKDGNYINPAGIIQDVTWSGDIKSPARTLDFTLVHPVFDEQGIRKCGIDMGDTIKMFINYNDAGFKEEFRGIIIDVDKDSGNNNLKCTAKDYGMFLSDKYAMNIDNMKVEDVAKAVIKKVAKNNKVSIGDIATTGKTYTKLVTDSTAYDIIMARYTEASKKTGKKYMTYAHTYKINTCEKGKTVLNLMFSEEYNVFNTTYKASLDKMVNKIIVTDDQGNTTEEKVDKAMLELYKITKQEIQKKDSNDEGFKKPEKSVIMKAVGNIHLMTGCAVHVKDEATGLTGVFYVDSDKHDFEEHGYTTTVDLNFENIMDEKEISENKTEGGGDGS